MSKEKDHISDVRSMLMEQLRALREAPAGAKLQEELRRAKGVSELAQTIVNTARVEVDYIVAVKGASDSPFLQAPDEAGEPRIPTRPQSPLPAPDDPARLGGPPANHPWRGNVTRNRL